MTNPSQIQIPVVDIGPHNPQAPQLLLEAAAKYGFVYIENSPDIGIAVADVDQIFSLSKTFFASPLEVKEACSIASNKAGKNHGWLSRGIEKLDPATQRRPDVKEAFNLGLPNPSTGIFDQPIPESLRPHTTTLITFQESCQRFCNLILERFAQALRIDDDWFTSRHDSSQGPTGTVFRLLYYPHTADQEQGVDIRAGAHSDYGSITLLFQLPGQPGLEIKTPEGTWAPVPVDPSPRSSTPPTTSASAAFPSRRPLPILVNIGDLLEDWTGGLLKSTVHRVVFPRDDGEGVESSLQGRGSDRYSLAYFCHPLDEARLEPVPSRVVREYVTANAARRSGRPGERVTTTTMTTTTTTTGMTAKEHLMERLAATYHIKSNG